MKIKVLNKVDDLLLTVIKKGLREDYENTKKYRE